MGVSLEGKNRFMLAVQFRNLQRIVTPLFARFWMSSSPSSLTGTASTASTASQNLRPVFSKEEKYFCGLSDHPELNMQKGKRKRNQESYSRYSCYFPT